MSAGSSRARSDGRGSFNARLGTGHGDGTGTDPAEAGSQGAGERRLFPSFASESRLEIELPTFPLSRVGVRSGDFPSCSCETLLARSSRGSIVQNLSCRPWSAHNGSKKRTGFLWSKSPKIRSWSSISTSSICLKPLIYGVDMPLFRDWYVELRKQQILSGPIQSRGLVFNTPLSS